jgi:two-component system, chemotaxis family, sensor kinase CheA
MEGLEDIVEEFLVESHENLDQLDRDLVELERQPDSRDLLSSVFRTLHTIKGTSGFLAFGTLESVTHVGESLLSRLRDGELTLDPQMTTVMLEMVDAVRTLLADIERTGTEGERDYADLVARLNAILSGETPAFAEAPAGAAGAALPAPEVPTVPAVLFDEPDEPASDEPRRSLADSTIRVDVGLLDSLMNLVGELVLTRNQMLQRAAEHEDVELQRTTHRLNLIAGELQEGVMKTRMQPIDHVWSKLPRVVRDLSVLLGKDVQLRMEGSDTELDKTILEAVRDPLTHLVRNAVDHGVEAAADRLAAGKPATGTLVLRAFHEGGQVNIEIADDGAGIDPARLRLKAVDRAMLSADAAARLSDHEAVQLVFAPGFSTAAAVTNVSGRGVGMDVVKTNIERIGGTIDLASAPGAGTTVRIRIPLTLAIIPALVVSSAGNRYALPQVNLLELVRLDPHGGGPGIEWVHGAPVHRLRGRLLPLVHLREQLGLEPLEQGATYIAVLDADGRQYGLVVDEIRNTEEIVVKPLGKQLRGIPLYAGATIMGDGQVALILDATALARKAGMTTAELGSGPAEAETAQSGNQRLALLVVALGDGRRAGLDLASVDRLEEIAADRVEHIGHQEVVQYRGEILPLLRLDHALSGRAAEQPETLQVVVCRSAGRRVGVVVREILDIVDEEVTTRTHLEAGGHGGSAVVAGVVTELVDLDRTVGAHAPALLVSAP